MKYFKKKWTSDISVKLSPVALLSKGAVITERENHDTGVLGNTDV